jgi:pyrimidine operon attenuation protein/uracil phosphoribosyltransferase
MIGLYTGGAWLAERLHPLLGLKDPLGLMDIAFYRDDYAKEGLKHDPKRTKIPFEVEGRDSCWWMTCSIPAHGARGDE